MPTESQQVEGVFNYHDISSRIQGKQFEALISNVEIQQGWKVLDVGCGTGRNTQQIAQMVGPNGKVIGIDPIKERIEFASKKYGSKNDNLEFHVSFGKDIDQFGEDFDLIISVAVVHWIEHDEKLLTFRKILQCLKPNGYFLSSTQSERLNNVFGFLPLLPQEISSKLNQNFHVESKDSLESLLLSSNFHNISIDLWLTEIPFESLDEAINWFAASVHVLDFDKFVQCLKEISTKDDISFMYNDKGDAIYKNSIWFLKCQKPEN